MLPEFIPIWQWIVLGFIMFALEMLGTSGFLLGLGLAAFLTGFTTWLLGTVFILFYQLMLFGTASVLLSGCVWWMFRQQQQKPTILNNRAAQMIGRTTKLESTLINGQGRIQFGDTFWKVSADESIQSDTRLVVVESVAKDGITLNIKALTD